MLELYEDKVQAGESNLLICICVCIGVSVGVSIGIDIQTLFCIPVSVITSQVIIFILAFKTTFHSQPSKVRIWSSRFASVEAGIQLVVENGPRQLLLLRTESSVE